MTFTNQARIDQFEMPHPSGDGTFKISVWRPDMPEGAKDLPVLFLTDADISVGLAAEIARVRGVTGMQPTAMIVGIGYGANFAEFAKLRTADLTPSLSEAGKQALGSFTSVIGDKEGGAEALLSFIIDALAPEIGRRYPEASTTEHILSGHSLGGLFASYALLSRPDAFSVFLSSSPSLWWDGFAILSHLPAFTAKLATLDRKPRVLVTVGAKEQDLPTKVPAGIPMSLADVQAMVAASRMVDAAAEFAVSLREAGLTEVAYTAFEDEDHGSVIPAALTRGLGFAVPLPE